MTLAIDHVIVAVRDLEVAAQRLRDTAGLASVPGGRHPGHGTGNRIIPMAGAYLELMAVIDRAEAEQSPVGRHILELTQGRDRPFALCLRTDDLGAVCHRLRLDPVRMDRTTPDGRVLSWSLAGLAEMLGPESLPFFIEWHVAPGDHPAETLVGHPGGAAMITRVDLGGDGDRIREWLGDAELPVMIEPGAPGVHAVLLDVGGHRVSVD